MRHGGNARGDAPRVVLRLRGARPRCPPFAASLKAEPCAAPSVLGGRPAMRVILLAGALLLATALVLYCTVLFNTADVLLSLQRDLLRTGAPQSPVQLDVAALAKR